MSGLISNLKGKTSQMMNQLQIVKTLRTRASVLIEAADLLEQSEVDKLPPKKRSLSAAARGRIAKAQKVRWAKWKAKKAA